MARNRKRRTLNLKNLKELFFLVFTLLLFTLPLMQAVNAQSDGLNLEAEQNWDTYRVGGTCAVGTQNIFVGDVDGDGASEIVTGGFSYGMSSGSGFGAPFKVWTWNGQNVTLKASMTWSGAILCLYAADVDQDGTKDILCAGSSFDGSGNSTSSLRVLNLIGEQATLKAEYAGIPINAMFVSDVDKDGVNDLLTVGQTGMYSKSVGSSQLSLFHLQGSDLTLVKSLPLAQFNVTCAISICASDLDDDGTVEIIVAGYSDSLSNSKGLVSIFCWDGQEFSQKTAVAWQLTGGTAINPAGGTQGNTAVNNVKAGDLDGDGKKEIVTAGFAYDGTRIDGQVKVWRWDGSNLIELANQEWTTDYMTEAKSVALNDVNGDGKVEIVQSGIVAAEGSFNNPEAVHDRGQLRVWSFNGTGLSLIETKDWTFDEGVCAWNVGCGDVDQDGVVEMITVGCSALHGDCDPDMRIWSLALEPNASPSYLPYAAVVMLIVASVSYLIFLYFRKTKVQAPK
jgi:hypothetical protein